MNDFSKFLGKKVKILWTGTPLNEKIGVLACVDEKIATVRLDGFPPRFDKFDDPNYGLAYVKVHNLEIIK